MRILFIGNNNRRTNAQQYYSPDHIVLHGLIKAGHNVHFFSDRDEFQQCKKMGFVRWGAQQALNNKLLKVVQNFKPDMVLLAHANLIANSTLEAMREIFSELRIGQLSVDAVYAPKNKAYLDSRRGYVDAVFITSGGEAIGQFGTAQAPSYFIPNFTDSAIDEFKAHTQTREALKFDVAYFAHATRPTRDDFVRIQLARDLQTNIPTLRCAYAGFDDFQSIRGFNFMSTLGHSAIGLSISRRVIDHCESTMQTRYLYSSDRIARQMGNGLLTFIENGFALDQLYPQDTAVFFDDISDLTEKVQHYLTHDGERQKIAKNGYEFAHNQLNSVLGCQYMIERTMGWSLSQNYVWPTQGFWRE